MRSNWDAYFLDIAKMVATRATCDRKHVGAVIVKDKAILSTGYNGSVRNLEHCSDVGHMMVDGHCVRTVHAEANALALAAKYGHAVSGASIYVTAHPCWNCFKLLVNSGIHDVYYSELYRPDPAITAALKEFNKLGPGWVRIQRLED